MNVYSMGAGVLTVRRTKGEVLLHYEAKDPEPGQPKVFALRFRDWKQFMDFTSEMLHEGTLAWPEVKKLYEEVS